MTSAEPKFTPAADVAAILHTLLDIYERRHPITPILSHPDTPPRSPMRSIHYTLDGYHSQLDPALRQIAGEQFQELERLGLVKLDWLPGETGRLLASVTLIVERAAALFTWLGRTPQAAHRSRLIDLLLGARSHFNDWRSTAVQHAIGQIENDKSPAPFNLTDDEFNHDLLTALAALDQLKEETPYRVFSVRVFNDGKRFEALVGAVCSLARLGCFDWRGWSNEEILRELNLTTNPTHLYLHGPWRLTNGVGQVISCGEFYPSVGLPAAQVQHVRYATVNAGRVVCVENQTTFYTLVRHASESAQDSLAALCLWGNPSPACRHLLQRLIADLPAGVPVSVWADIDYGGLNILAQLREQVSPRFEPYRMDVVTLEAYAPWARPLTPGDERNLVRLMDRASLADLRPLIDHMLVRGLKLEQEAIDLSDLNLKTP